MANLFEYTLKVWLTTLIAPPLVSLLIACCIDVDNAVNHIPVYCCILIVSLAASFLTWIAFLFAVYKVLKLKIPASRQRFLILTFGLALTLTTFLLLGAGFLPDYVLRDLSFWFITLLYIICLAASIHFYQLPHFDTEQ